MILLCLPLGHPLGRPAGSRSVVSLVYTPPACRRGKNKKRLKIGRAVIGPQYGGTEGEGEEGGVSKNDIMGIAVRPRPVGERREGLLEKVCGRKGRFLDY